MIGKGAPIEESRIPNQTFPHPLVKWKDARLVYLHAAHRARVMTPDHSLGVPKFITARLSEVLAEVPHHLCAEITNKHEHSGIVSMFPA